MIEKAVMSSVNVVDHTVCNVIEVSVLVISAEASSIHCAPKLLFHTFILYHCTVVVICGVTDRLAEIHVQLQQYQGTVTHLYYCVILLLLCQTNGFDVRWLFRL